MNNLIRCCALLFLLSITSSLYAVVLIEFKQGDGAVDRMYFQGMKVRVDSSSEPGYVIIDLGKNKIVAVSHEEKKIIDMGGVETEEEQYQQPLDIQLVNKGKGPKIVGYPTTHYVVMVNGKKCSDEFLNKKIPKDLGIDKVLEKMPTGSSGMDMMEDMGMEMDPCLMAEVKISKMFVHYGYPLRSIKANGELDAEVTRIDKNAKTPQGGFGFPKGYERIDAGQMMQNIQNQIQNMPELTPEGMKNVTPEQMQQMQQMMEQMMKKMGQSGE